MESIYWHLASRLMNPDLPHVHVDEENRCATFLLYNLSGKLVGYQTYRPDQPSNNKRNNEKGRYYTYVSNEGDDNPKNGRKHIAFYGAETLNRVDGVSRKLPVFIVEGVFDACVLHYHGYPAIAVLQNDPKKMKSFFRALAMPTIAITDGDSAGKKLAKIADVSMSCPSGQDLSSMAENDWNGACDFIHMAVHFATKG